MPIQKKIPVDDHIQANKQVYKTITATEALNLAHEYGKTISMVTLIAWCDNHVPKLLHRPGGHGGRLYIFEDPFIAFISGQEELCKEMLLNMVQPSKEVCNGES